MSDAQPAIPSPIAVNVTRIDTLATTAAATATVVDDKVLYRLLSTGFMRRMASAHDIASGDRRTMISHRAIRGSDNFPSVAIVATTKRKAVKYCRKQYQT